MSDSQSPRVHLPTQEGYDRWSNIYDDEDNALVKLETELFAQLLGDVQGKRVLDVGCGTGRHAIVLHDQGADVTAVDFSEGMLDKARAKRPNGDIEFLQHDLETHLPFEDDSFERVVCGLVIDHIANLDGLFREMRRVSHADGFVAVSVMHPAMMLKGVQARFTDPETGIETRPASRTHQISDYVSAALSVGLSIKTISEHLVDEDLASRSLRARKHIGWPLLLLMKLVP